MAVGPGQTDLVGLERWDLLRDPGGDRRPAAAVICPVPARSPAPSRRSPPDRPATPGTRERLPIAIAPRSTHDIPRSAAELPDRRSEHRKMERRSQTHSLPFGYVGSVYAGPHRAGEHGAPGGSMPRFGVRSSLRRRAARSRRSGTTGRGARVRPRLGLDHTSRGDPSFETWTLMDVDRGPNDQGSTSPRTSSALPFA
jgi:hypothetical protein